MTMTPQELAQSAMQHFENTAIDYPTWLNRVKNGYKGKPYDGSQTEWGKGFADLKAIIGGSANPAKYGESKYGEGTFG